MESVRTIKETLKSKSVLEGAGVQLKRVFGFHEVPKLDPFLLFDDFHSSNPDDYIKGFPWHPHRGIETISYMLQGSVEHGDSMGNKGTISQGDVQWMTAGSGIIHQEMPRGDTKKRLWGFQLWANLPAKYKMMAPRYQEIKQEQIPETFLKNNVVIKVICGSLNGIQGPVKDIVIEPEFLDITIPSHTIFSHNTKKDHTVFAYILDGSGIFDPDRKKSYTKETLVIFDQGTSIEISTDKESVRFLLISGKPINEPIAWHGPIVMNTDKELEIAFEEYNNDTFLKH